MTTILKTPKQAAREKLHSSIISLHRSMVQDGHTEHPWSVYRTIGAKFGITGQAVYVILKRYNAL